MIDLLNQNTNTMKSHLLRRNVITHNENLNPPDWYEQSQIQICDGCEIDEVPYGHEFCEQCECSSSECLNRREPDGDFCEHCNEVFEKEETS